jgi:undecaprenyl-diphosphatase
MALVLFLIDKKNFVPELISFLIIVLLGGIIIQFLKHTFDKPRPLKLFQEILHQPINVIGEQLRDFGFPSGHTFLAFSSAVYISDKVKKKYITILVFFLALLVGISRILVGAHFLSDVIGGVVIGILFSWICLKIKHKLL